jgi:hypothetical protein
MMFLFSGVVLGGLAVYQRHLLTDGGCDQCAIRRTIANHEHQRRE